MELLRGVPNSSTVKKNSFQVIIECVRNCSRVEVQRKREAIPYRCVQDTKSAALHDNGTGK